MKLTTHIWIRNLLPKIRFASDGFLNAYSQVFFSDRKIFAILILSVTFLVPESGVAGAAGVIISILLAHWLGFDKLLISKGIFSYNTLLVTLPLGLFFEMGWPLFLMIVLAAILTFFLTVFFRERLARHGLPFLSWPFVIGLWLVMLAIRRFSSIEVGDQSLFELNRLYQIGGITLVNGMEWINDLLIPKVFQTYLASLGAVFFQYNLIAGVAIAAGLLISSRIAFLLSLAGFFSAYVFYQLIGLDINTLDYGYIGFNYILTAIAIGGFFLIPTFWSFIWTIILIPLVTLLAVGFEELLKIAGLGVYALPFNLLVPLFIAVLRQRQSRLAGLYPVVVQHNSPEKNLYAWSNFDRRLSRKTDILFRLPFLGKWKVSQGPDSQPTHQADWRFAWDFVKEGADGKTWSGDGSKLNDYHCYGKPVFPAADGVVDSIIEGIPDNPPGDVNTRQNWGNCVIVRHQAALFTKYAHLKPGSIRVKPGDYVTTSTELGLTGNSGRSPEPHLHFQFQAEPNINAATIDYPFGYFLSTERDKPVFRAFRTPVEHEWVSNLIPDPFLGKILHLIPGQKITGSFTRISNEKAIPIEWEVHTDIYNNSYVLDKQRNAVAWFVNDGQVFYFTHFDGPRNHPLQTFFVACFKIPLHFDPDLNVYDQLPITQMPKQWLRWLQDWIAPFRIFLHPRYHLRYSNQDDPVDPSVYRLTSKLEFRAFRSRIGQENYQVEFHRDGKIRITNPDLDGMELVILTK